MVRRSTLTKSTEAVNADFEHYRTMTKRPIHGARHYNQRHGHDAGNPGCSAFQARAGHRTGSPRPTPDADQDLLWLFDALRRSAQHERMSSVPRPAWTIARAESASG